jgi:primary-amine oxidase
VDLYHSDTYNTIVAFDSAKSTWGVENLLKLPEGTQPQITPGELLECEDIVKNDARVQALAKEVGKLNTLTFWLVIYSRHLRH